MSTLLGINEVDIQNADLPDQIEMSKSEIIKELKNLESMRSALDKGRKDYEADWESVADYTDPNMYWRSGKTPSDGNKSRSKIVNPTPTAALNVLQAGMFSGTANPTRSWFRIQHPVPEMNDDPEVKSWLTEVHDRMQNVMIRSNLYKALPTLFSQLGLFGIGAIVVVDDKEDVIRFHNRMVGQFYVANDERGNIGTYMEEQHFTVRQVVSIFGLKQCSQRVQNLYNEGNTESNVKVCFAVERNKEYNPTVLLDARFKKYRTTYWEKGARDEGGLLSLSGVDMFNVIVPRWKKNGNDPYGSGIGIEALPDFKSLSLAEKQLQLARELNVKPSWLAHSSLASAPKLFIPNGVTYVDDISKGLTPAHKVNLDEQGTRVYIDTLEKRIETAFQVPLFLMISGDERSNITATEIQARQQERMMALGPVLQNLNDEAFDPLIDLVYDTMDRAGMIPDPPEQIQSETLTIEYISILAQAQKAADVTSQDRYVGSVFNLANGDPEDPVLDILPKDQIARRYHELLGQHPDTIKTQDVVDEERANRSQQIQQQNELANASELANTAKTLSETSVEGNSALTEVLAGNV